MNSQFVVGASAVCSLACGSMLYKSYFQGCFYEPKEELHGATAIVTGANSGIGKETAKEFARRGAKVIMACRDLNRCRSARQEILTAVKYTTDRKDRKEKKKKRKPNVMCEHLDLASFDSIRAFADKMQSESNVKYLINNAATMRDPKRVLTKDGLEKQMGINHFGHFLLTNLLLNKLKESMPSRIVVLSSSAHYRGKLDFQNLNWDHDYEPGAAYNASKLANVLFVRHLAKLLEKSGVTVSAVHPGLVNTEIFRHMPVAQSISAFMFKPIMWVFLKSPRSGAQTTIYAALSPDLEGTTGQYYSNCQEQAPSEIALDDLVAERLWLVSQKWTKSTVAENLSIDKLLPNLKQ